MDVDAIRPGEDFVRFIQEKVAACDVLIALIGRHWLDSVDDRGLPRLQNPEDFVRLEIAHALARGIPVIPVLVAGASMPPAGALPGDLKSLSTRNALEIHDALFPESMQRLVNELKAGEHGHPFDRSTLRFRIAAGAAVITLIGALLAIFAPGSKAPSQGETSAADAIPDLDRFSQASVKHIKLQIPAKVTQLPAVIDDARSVLEPPGRHDVTGPRRPKVLWAAPVTTGDAWHILAIAGDGTAFIWDQESSVLSAVGNGGELWAYRPEPPRNWSLHGFDAEGRVWLGGNDLSLGPNGYGLRIGGRVAYCFNSRGEGGQVANNLPLRMEHPMNDFGSLPNRRDGLVTCDGGRVKNETGKQWTVEIDGNCPDWGVVRDPKGALYTSSDAGTFYSIAPDGKVRWTYRPGFQTDEPFFLFDDVVFGCKQGLFRLHDGAPRWKFSTSGGVMKYRSAPVFDQNGTIYFNADTTLMAVDNAGKLLWKYAHGSPLALDQKGRLYVLGGPGIASVAD